MTSEAALGDRIQVRCNAMPGVLQLGVSLSGIRSRVCVWRVGRAPPARLSYGGTLKSG